MPLRRRLALMSAAAVGLAVVLAAIVCYWVVRNQLLGQVDSQLQDQAQLVSQLRVQRRPAHASGQRGRRRADLAGGRQQRPDHVRHRPALRLSRPGGGERRRPGLLRRRQRRRYGLPGADRAGHRVLPLPGLARAGGAPARAAARAGQPRAHPPAPDPARPVPGRRRPGRDAGPAGRAARALSPGRGSRDGPAHLRDRGSEQPHPRPRRRRGGSDGHPVQRDDRATPGLALGAGRLGPGPAPADRRRLARAAHADHQPADQHRGADGRAERSARRIAGGCWPTCSSRARS